MTNINEAYARDLDLNLLRAFAVVSEEGSVTRAAARLYVTQPAVSSAIRRLESFVGAELFTRQGRGLVLTHRGTDLLSATRVHLGPLVDAALAAPVFVARDSTATVRIGLVDASEGLVLPPLLRALEVVAPRMQLVVLSVQFRTVEEMILSGKVDLALCVADELPRSILRKTVASGSLVCLHDARFRRSTRKISEKEYFAAEHVAVSYAGDTRGVVEDATGKTRRVKVSVPSFAHVADLVEGSALLGTVPEVLARHLLKTRRQLKISPLPFELEVAQLDLLWSRVMDGDPASRFARGLVEQVLVRPGGGAAR